MQSLSLIHRLRLLLAAGTLAAGPSCLQSALSPSPAGYLFATFRMEESALSEQVHFALSLDGYEWTALNSGEPVLVSDVGERGVRDPYILRSADGDGFYLIATDLSIHRSPDWSRAVRAGSRSIVVWESPDLVKWSEPRLVTVAAEEAGCTWAPEAIYDPASGDYLVFWASTTASDDFQKHRIWAARTPDFRQFSEPFIYIDRPTAVIDTTIVREGDTYFRFSKDEKFKAITLESSGSLEGPWQEEPDFSLARLTGYEGPQCFQLQPPSDEAPAVWALILDHYSRGQGYRPFITRDLASGLFEAAEEGFSFPFRFRHGSVLPLNAAEYERLQEAFGERP